MDVRINNMTSNIHATDSRAMLTPEVLDQIVQAVLTQLQEEVRRDVERERDMQINQSRTE
jgi:hypothetical protein